jgi:hypothetical protein
MQRISILILILTVMTTLIAFAAPGQSYYYFKNYDGPFAAERIYQLHSQTDIFYPSSRFETLADISCATARRGLKNNGRWVGNLSEAGDCLGSIEAPEYALGNLLNFEVSVKTKSQKNID